MSVTTSGTLQVDKQPDRPRFSWRRFFTHVVVILSWFPLGLLAFSLLGRYFFLAELIGNFRLQIMVLLLPFPLLLWTLKKPAWGLVLALATAWCAINIVWTYVPSAQPPAGPRQVRLMSFNLLGNNQQGEAVIQMIEDEQPEILTVLEYCGHWTKILNELDEHYPYRILEPRWHGFGIGIFSKIPIASSEVHLLTKTSTDSPAIVVHVQIGDQKLRIAGMHTLSPTDHQRLEIRNNQLAEMSTLLSRSTEPTIVMGDFNCTPWSPYLRDFVRKTDYRDSRQGFGYQGSWPAELWPMRIPIDQAFVSKEIHVHQRRLGESAGSDHFPLILDVSISGP
jgi:endonuclease/exonuclease/phosphatase (EEP) superfamily protein YafD